MSGKKTLHDLFHHQLKDAYDAARQSGKALVKMAKASNAPTLRLAIEKRHDDLSADLDRLETIFEAIDRKPHAASCEAMHGLVAETKALIEAFDEGLVLDAGLIGAAQAMEHHALARYASMRVWAETLKLTGVVTTLGGMMSHAEGALRQWMSLASRATEETSVVRTLTLKEAALVGLR